MFFFVGWPKVIPLKSSQVIDIQHNPSNKVWTVVLTKDRISIWTFSLNQNLLLGFLQRTDLKNGENRYVLWSYDSRKIAVVTSKLFVYLYYIEEMPELIINVKSERSMHGHESLLPKVKKMRIEPYKSLHLVKLPALSTITKMSHLTNDVFVIATNYGQLIHIHWKGYVELTCQLNLKNKKKSSKPKVEEHDSNNNNNSDNQHRNRNNNVSITRFSDKGIIDLAISAKLGVMAVVFNSGSCWIIPLYKLSKSIAATQMSVNQTTYIADYENVRCCAICDRFHFLALGLRDGTAVIYELNLDLSHLQSILTDDQNASAKSESPSSAMASTHSDSNNNNKKIGFDLHLITVFNAQEFDLIPAALTLGEVKEVEWCDSGSCLAISWLKGVVVYSIRGLVIFSTLHHQQTDGHHRNLNRMKDETKADPLTTYFPSCLKWLQKDSGFLMVTHQENVREFDLDEPIAVEHPNHSKNAYLIQITCLRHALGNLCQSDSSKLALLASNYLSIWRPVHIIDDHESTDYWSRIEIDSYYLSRNWPIRELALNPRNDCIAIAGLTGFAMYYRRTAQWKVVRSLDGIRILYTCVMAWLSNDLLFITTFDPTFDQASQSSASSSNTSKHSQLSKWKLLCFDRRDIDQYFSVNSGIAISDEFQAVFEYALTNHPIGMEIVDQQRLLIYFVDGVIHIYDINLSSRSADSPSLSNSVFLSPNQSNSQSIQLHNHTHNYNSNYRNSNHHSSMHAETSNAAHSINTSLPPTVPPSVPLSRNSSLPNSPTENISLFSQMFATNYSPKYNNHSPKKDRVIVLKNYCVMAPFETLSAHPASLRMWIYESEADSNHFVNNSNDAGFCLLMLDAARILYQINPLNNEREIIESGLHDFYLIKETRDKRDTTYLWTYSTSGVKRWYSTQGKLESLFLSPNRPHMTSIGICNTLNVFVFGRRIIRRVEPLFVARFAIHIEIRSYLHATIEHKLKTIGVEQTFQFVLNAIAGGAWRCEIALENILRSALIRFRKQKKKLKRQQQKHDSSVSNNCSVSMSRQSSEDTTNASMMALAFDDQDIVVTGDHTLNQRQSLRSNYVFYAKDIQRDYSSADLVRAAAQQSVSDSSSDGVSTVLVDRTMNALSSDDQTLNEDVVINAIRNGITNNNNGGHHNGNGNDNGNDAPVIINKEVSIADFHHHHHPQQQLHEQQQQSIDNTKELSQQMALLTSELSSVISFLKRFPDYPGIVVNVARKTEPSQWKDLFAICGSPHGLIEKSIRRNQLTTASKYLYVFEKTYIEYAVHFVTLLMELAVDSGANNLVLSLLRFAHKLKLMLRESNLKNIVIPQLDIL